MGVDSIKFFRDAKITKGKTFVRKTYNQIVKEDGGDKFIDKILEVVLPLLKG